MSIIASNVLAGASGQAAGGYQIQRSLRFNSSDSGFCSRTPASAGNRKTWTWAGWVKLGTNFGVRRMLFGGGTIANSIPNTYLEITDSAQLGIDSVDPPSFSTAARVRTTAVLRDPSAWYHIVFSIDTTQATAANRIKIYINGVEQTSYSSTTYPSQNYDSGINSTQIQTIGAYPEAAFRAGLYFDGYLADIHFIDGQALTPSSFTEVSATTGQLVPIEYTGTYGTNGFHLDFSDNSAATATTLGKDRAGSNNWTPNNLSVTAGSGNDSLVDTPTSYGTDTGAGGEVRGNYCTINPLDNGGGLTLSNGNLEAENTAASSKGARCTIKIPSTGKWYFEGTIQTLGGSCALGVATSASANPFLNAAGTFHILNYAGSGIQTYPGGRGYTFTTAQVGNVLQVAYDADSGNLWFGVNNTYCDGSTGGTGNPSAGTNPTYTSVSDVFPAVEQFTSKIAVNFGQRPFAYAAPSGFKALCDTNLPAPVVAKPNEVMDVVLYTGNGSARSITGLGFNPDFVWIKGRSGATDHALYDAVRGVQLDLISNSTAAETTQAQGLTAFNSDGFSLGTLAKLNTNAATYAGWAWDAGSSTVTNTQGSISSQVRANPSAGFSVVTYTGNGSSGATVGHGLGVTPEFFIVKCRNTAATAWLVYAKPLGATSFLQLESTAAVASNATAWNNTAPSSTTITLGNSAFSNGNTQTYVCYAFAPVAGYSSFGSYTGNGSADGPFVYTGMRPRYLLWKRSDSTADWTVFDAARDSYNHAEKQLLPNSSVAEQVTGGGFVRVDFLSNGFKIRGSDSYVNASGGTYIFASFAEHPFAYARAR